MTETLIQPATLVELLRYRATAQPDGHAYTFLIDGKKETPPLTYSELDRQARAIAGSSGRFLWLSLRGSDCHSRPPTGIGTT